MKLKNPFKTIVRSVSDKIDDKLHPKSIVTMYLYANYMYNSRNDEVLIIRNDLAEGYHSMKLDFIPRVGDTFTRLDFGDYREWGNFKVTDVHITSSGDVDILLKAGDIDLRNIVKDNGKWRHSTAQEHEYFISFIEAQNSTSVKSV